MSLEEVKPYVRKEFEGAEIIYQRYCDNPNVALHTNFSNFCKSLRKLSDKWGEVEMEKRTIKGVRKSFFKLK